MVNLKGALDIYGDEVQDIISKWRIEMTKMMLDAFILLKTTDNRIGCIQSF